MQTLGLNEQHSKTYKTDNEYESKDSVHHFCQKDSNQQF